jgi:hypothetical protein
MAKRGSHRKHRLGSSAGSRQAQGAARSTPRKREPNVLDDVRHALSRHPLELLEYASSILVCDPRRQLVPLPADLARRASALHEAAEILLRHDCAESSSLLAVFARMSDDMALREFIEPELSRRMSTVPEWIVRLDEVVVRSTIEVTHACLDVTRVIVGLRLATGEDLSVVVSIDPDSGGWAANAFAVPVSLDTLLAKVRELTGAERECRATEIGPADARARITAAIAATDALAPRLETETWPDCRPLVEWVTRMLPAVAVIS